VVGSLGRRVGEYQSGLSSHMFWLLFAKKEEEDEESKPRTTGGFGFGFLLRYIYLPPISNSTVITC